MLFLKKPKKPDQFAYTFLDKRVLERIPLCTSNSSSTSRKASLSLRAESMSPMRDILDAGAMLAAFKQYSRMSFVLPKPIHVHVFVSL
jgi:hypothetical protein